MTTEVKFTISKEYPTQDFAEHEIFLSFNEDLGAEMFRDWLEQEGKKAFEQWVHYNKSQYE